MIDSWPTLFLPQIAITAKSAGGGRRGGGGLGWRGVVVKVGAGGGGVANVAALFLRSLFPSRSLLDAP